MNTTSHSIRPLAMLGFAAGIILSFALPAAAQPAPAPKEERRFVAYKITRGDTVSVVVLGEELTAPQKRVEATGTISLPYIQDIRIHGLTINEAQDAIAKAYRDGRYLRNPVVTVTVESYAPRMVIVSGKVNQQGRLEIPADVEMTIKEMIFKAGGFGDTAKASAVRVTRTMPDGSYKIFTLDVESAIKGKSNSTSGDAAFVLQPDDIIFVPEKII